MKSVLMSIQPYWVFLIIAKAMGWNYPKEKTIEVRKSCPKTEEWDRIVEIYCTKSKDSFNLIPKEYQPFMRAFLGKIVGEFVCDKIIDARDIAEEEFYEKSCISLLDWHYYTDNHKGKVCCWHILDLKVYDEPKELSEFDVLCKDYAQRTCDTKCFYAEWNRDDSGNIFCDCSSGGYKPLARPPQSWCYVWQPH